MKEKMRFSAMLGHTCRTTTLFAMLFGFVVALFPLEGRAANFYVRAGATGAKTGADWTNAWSEFGQLNWTSINAGDTVYIAAGTYGPLNISKSGTAGNPIKFIRATVSAHGTDTGWSSSYDARVIIDGQDNLGAIGIGQAVFKEIDYITVDGATRYGIWVRNAFYGVRAGYGSNGLTLRNLEIGDSGTYKMDEDGIQGSGDDLLVEKCFVHDNDSAVTHGDGIQWFGGNRVTLRYNVWKNNGQQIYLGEGNWNSVVNDVNIYYNVIHNRGGGHYNGIVIFGNSSQSGHFYNVYNNTFDLEALDNGGFNNLFYPYAGNATINFKNNAIIASNASGLDWMTVHNNNAFDNSGTGLVYNIPATETGKIAAAALGFVDQTNSDYHLTASSPLIAKGVSVGLSVDFDGNAVGATPSIGAFEYGTSAGATPAPTPVPSATPVPTATPVATPTPMPTAAPAITGETLLGSSSPSSIDANDGVAYELGMKFSATTAGQITAIRFYKSPSESGTHTGKIYSSSGALLASVAFTNESASGWQTAYLTTPLAMAANTTYTVSVNTGAGYYVSTAGDFATAKSSADLLTPVSAGVYGAAGAMPTQSFQSSNYFRDVVFVAANTGSPSPTPMPTAMPSQTDTVKPTVAVTSPTDGARVARSTTTTIAVNASDNVAVTKVEFYVNGTLKCTDTAAPYSCAWVVPRGRNVPYAIQAKAYDAAGNVGASATVNVTSR
jgi:hypothetical protein